MARNDLSLAGILKLRSLIDTFELPDSIDIPADIEPLVRETSYTSSDFEAEERTLVEDIRFVGASWADEPCDRVIHRLVLLRGELNRANLTWPNRHCDRVPGHRSVSYISSGVAGRGNGLGADARSFRLRGRRVRAGTARR